MFTWICPKCGREVPPAYDECPDCAAKAAAQAVPGSAPPPAAAAPPQQSMPAAPPPGPRGGRRPLWATGPQEGMPPAPPPAYAPPQPPPPPAPAVPPEAPPVFQPVHSTSPMFQPAPPQPAQPTYVVPQPAGFRLPVWAMAVLFGVGFIGLLYGAYMLFSQHGSTSSAVIVAPPAKPGAADENPAQKYIEVAGVRFSPISKGIQVAFVVINHSDSDIVGLAGTATVFAKTDKGDETPVGTVDFQTSIPAQSSKELQLPFTTKMKLMEMPDWQNVDVKVKITGPNASGPA